jgi:hypothetical protein
MLQPAENRTSVFGKSKRLVDSYFIQPEMPGEISPHPEIQNAKTGESISPGQLKFHSFE